MITWKIGKVSITKLLEFETPMVSGTPDSMVPNWRPELLREMPWLAPHYLTPEGEILMSVHALLVQTPSMRLIVDTCVGNDKERAIPTFNKLKTNFLRDLEATGWTRDSVDAILCTHLHIDHVGWNTVLENGRWVPTFPRARYYMAARELEHTLEEAVKSQHGPIPGQVMADSIRPILDAGLAVTVEMDAQLTPEVRLMPSPGHTPGHCCVVVESEGARAVITGDSIHHPCQIARPHWSSGFDIDQDLSRATRIAFVDRYADTPTLVIGTHFAGPTGGKIVREGSAYRFVA